MTRRAAAGAIVAGMVVGSRQRHYRIQQARFLQPQKNGIGAQLRAKAAFTKFVVWLARVVIQRRITDFTFLAAAAFEYPQHVTGLRSLPAIERIQLRQHALGTRFFRRRRGRCLYGLRLAVAIVTFSETSIFLWV